jgi:hypothetical protein
VGAHSKHPCGHLSAWPRSIVRNAYFIIIALLATVSAARVAEAQPVSGRVVEAAFGQGVSGAMVQLVAEDSTVLATVFTDSAGAFQLPGSALPGQFVYVARFGYRNLRMVIAEVRRKESLLEIELVPEPVILPRVEATAESRNRWLESNGFYERMKLSNGQFVTRDMLADRFQTNRRVSEVLRQVPGVVRVDESVNNALVYLRSPQVKISWTPCPAMIYVNGLQQGKVLPRTLPADVEAIEIYRGPSQVPARWSGAEAACGVILIWLRT